MAFWVWQDLAMPGAGSPNTVLAHATLPETYFCVQASPAPNRTKVVLPSDIIWPESASHIHAVLVVVRVLLWAKACTCGTPAVSTAAACCVAVGAKASGVPPPQAASAAAVRALSVVRQG